MLYSIFYFGRNDDKKSEQHTTFDITKLAESQLILAQSCMSDQTWKRGYQTS